MWQRSRNVSVRVAARRYGSLIGGKSSDETRLQSKVDRLSEDFFLAGTRPRRPQRRTNPRDRNPSPQTVGRMIVMSAGKEIASRAAVLALSLVAALPISCRNVKAAGSPPPQTVAVVDVVAQDVPLRREWV